MPTKSKSVKSRTKVQDIPQRAKGLSKAEQKKVKGGFTGGVFVAVGDVTGDGKEIIKRSTPGPTK